MQVSFPTSQLRIVAVMSMVALGSAAGTHRSQDLYQLFRSDEARFVYGKVQQSLQEKDRGMAFQLTRAILKESKKRSIDPVFLLAMIEQESHFRTNMVGLVGEIGLMQIRPQTARWIGKRFGIPYHGRKSLFNVTINVQFGAAYLGYLKDHYSSTRRLFVPAYNMGIHGLHVALQRGNHPTTYLNGIESKYHRLKHEYRAPASFSRSQRS